MLCSIEVNTKAQIVKSDFDLRVSFFLLKCWSLDAPYYDLNLVVSMRFQDWGNLFELKHREVLNAGDRSLVIAYFLAYEVFFDQEGYRRVR